MKRLFIWPALALIMYGLYMYTLPAAPAPDTARAAAQARVSARVTLPRTRMYAVALGVYETEEAARPYAARHVRRGAAGCIVETQEGWAIIGAAYDNDSEARSVCRRLSETEGIDARVMLFGAEEIRLCVNAMSSQTELLSRALDAVSHAPGELMSLAESIDSGESDPSTVRALIAVRAGELDELRTELAAALGDTADIFSRMIETRLVGLCDALSDASARNGPSGLALSSALRQCAVETWLELIGLMNTLG